METTFMTIHNLTREANILFASESIFDILGYQPGEVIGRSCFDYFHPDEVPAAKKIHSRGVQMDKAAVLHYARIRSRDGEWIGCECVFTVVYEVMVACISIYRGDAKNERRAVEAPAIRRLFASSPRDPRYHMLEHLSSKFRTPPHASLLEPRAALILNRFTRTLTVMYATNAVSSILGVTPQQLKDKSFYECMQENCLSEAIRCLESAKANDSIAYLRFRLRDPRQEEDFDEEIQDASQSSDSEDGGVEISAYMDVDLNPTPGSVSAPAAPETSGNGESSASTASSAHPSLGDSADLEHAPHAIFDGGQASRSSSSLLAIVPAEQRLQRRETRSPIVAAEPLEIEAVVSCTSDGLVVVLRKARPMIPSVEQPVPVSRYENGIFAAPWGANPIRPHQYQPNPQFPFQHGLQAPQLPAGGPPLDEFMTSIREVAVFAWSLTGINGNIASYGHGIPRGEAQPPQGLPVWDPHAQPSPGYMPPENQAAQRWARYDEKINNLGDNRAPFQHSHQEQLPREHVYGSMGMGQNHSVSTVDTTSPAYTFQPQPAYSQGYNAWPPAPQLAANNYSQIHQSQGSRNSHVGSFRNPNPWY